MGQKVGKAKFIPQARPFLNANKQVMETMWNNFNEIAEGFGLNVGEFQKIVDIEGLKATAADARAVFKCFDTDNNGLVDALEFLTTFALSSGLNHEETIKYAFRCYDFDESGELTVDEMTLSMKSTLSGLAKLTGTEPPDTLELEDIAQQAFARADKNADGMITFEEYEDYCLHNPEVRSWIHYFDDPEEDLEDEDLPVDSDLELECNAPERSEFMEAARNPELGIEFELEEEGGGDQFMSVKPYLGTVRTTQPSDPPPVDKRVPNTTMTLEWVHGYRAQDTRNNLRYTGSGEIAYHAAAVGIVYNADSHSQRFNLDHTDDICSMAMHPDGQFVATGEMGRKPKIVIWDSADKEGVMDSAVVLQGYHRRAVIQLAFSPNGNLLASVGQDNDHSVAVYDWRKNRKVFAEKSHRNKVLASCWRDEQTFVTCGVKHIFFWDMKDRRKAKGIFGRANGVKMQPLLCVAPLGGEHVVTGTASGHLYVWSGRTCVKAVKAHNGSVYACYSTSQGLATGGRDGKVRLFSHSLETKNVFDITTFGSVTPAVRSVCWDIQRHRLLVGTMGSEIYEINSRDGTDLHSGPLVQGHYQHELWGLATHPSKQEYVTVGDDWTVRVWDVATRKCINMAQLKGMARAVAFSPDGTQLAIGFGGDVGQRRASAKDKNTVGAFVVLAYPALTELSKYIRDSRKWISDIKFSPTGGTLAVGSHDCKIRLYDTSDWGILGTCSKHHSYITHFDFSDDGKWLQSNSGDYELLFYDATTGEQQVSAPSMKDLHWQSWTCTLGWWVQGIWPPCADGTDVNAVARSHDERTVATADDFGRVKLFRFPVVTKDYLYTEYIGHSSHVTNVRWTAGDRYLITVGGNDRCAFQWRCAAEDDEEVAEAKLDLDSDDELYMQTGSSVERSDAQERANGAFQMDFGMEAEEEEGGGDQFMSVKPWKGAIVEPTAPPPVDASVPDDELTLEWVHGFRSQDSRNNVRYNKAGELVYPAAGLGVVMNVGKDLQRFNFAHTDDVICMAMHPDGVHVATGQMGKKPQVVIWDSMTMETVAVIQGLHRRAVCEVAFSPDGRLLATVGQDDDHTCAVYDWANLALKCSAKGDKGKTLGLAFAPDGKSVCQVGVKHIKFHQFRGRTMKTKKATLGRKGNRQPFLCVEYVGNNALVGCHDGHMYLFMGRALKKSVPAHEAAVTALHVSPSAGIVTGSKDGKVKIWTDDLAPAAEFDVRDLGSFRPQVRTVAWSANAKRLLVGTLGSELYEVHAKNGHNVHDHNGPVLQGHCQYELWGLAVHPTAPQYATVGDDATLRVWDVASHKQVNFLKLPTLARAVAYSPDGDRLAVGFGGDVGRGRQKEAGSWWVLRASDLSKLVVPSSKDSKQWISDIKFAPDGNTLAVGSHDNKIYLYDSEAGSGDSYPSRCIFKKHNSYITHFDFSADSKFMQSNCGAYELLFSDVTTGMHLPAASAMKDTEWATWTCTLGWPVQGIWPAFSDGTDVNATSRDHSGRVIATADDFGRVKLYRYPCTVPKAAFKEYRGHSSHVTNVRWTAGDKYVITCGGNDQCVFQWLVERDEAEGTAAYDAADDPAASDPIVTEQLAEFTFEEDEEGGDRFMAVKPWVGAMVEPTKAPPFNHKRPELDLQLEWVYGYRAQDARNNLRYNDAGEIVYSAAGVGVIYDKVRHHQKHYIGHDDDVVCLAVDPSGNFVATGQQGRYPQVHVWDSETGLLLTKLPRFHRRAVSSVAFSPDGKHLLSVGEDDDHSVATWSSPSGTWTDGVLSGKCKGDKSKVLFANWCTGGGFSAVTGGVKHVRFWTVKAGKLKSKRGKFGRRSSTVISAANLDKKTVTGTVTGHIYVWTGTTITKAYPAHDKSPVTALAETVEGLVSGDKKGQIRTWSTAFELLSTIDLTKAAPAPLVPAIRSVCMNKEGTLLLVGTQGSEIYEVTTVSHKMTLLAEGHCRDELWGLAMHPTSRDLFATSGDDKTVRVWNMADHKLVNKAELKAMTRAVAFSPDGSLLACGLGGRVGGTRSGRKDGPLDGGMAVLRTDTMEELPGIQRVSKRWIQEVKFSPDGSLCAVGSHDSKIYLYDARGGAFKLKAKCDKHRSYITHIDFSSDSAVLQSNCGAYELLFFNTSNGEQITSASATRDTEWATWSCVLGWPVQGIFPPEFDGTDINSCDRSHNNQWVATADDRGMVKVYNYPCLKNTAEYAEGIGHSSHVTNVRWNVDDSYLVTCGGNDRCIFQWKINRK